jgi:acetyl-CoA carboxylase biotin carboxyl carrier protein
VNEARIRKLIEIFRDSGVEEMEYRESFWRGISLRLGRRRADQTVSFTSAPAAAPAPVPVPPAAPQADVSPAAPSGAAAPAEPEPPAADPGHPITSPMVGTYYHAPSPEAEAFVQTGDRVQKGQTVCIIEAMKIMNEIESDVDGEILEICVTNGAPVEYGQPLFRVRPA